MFYEVLYGFIHSKWLFGISSINRTSPGMVRKDTWRVGTIFVDLVVCWGHRRIFQTFLMETTSKNLRSRTLIMLKHFFLVFLLDDFDWVCSAGISTITATGPQVDGIFN